MVGSYLGSCVQCAVAFKAKPLCVVGEGAENEVGAGVLLLQVLLCQIRTEVEKIQRKAAKVTERMEQLLM